MPLINTVNDNFNRVNSTTVGGIWSQSASSNCSNSIENNQLKQVVAPTTTGFHEAKTITTSTYDLAESNMFIKLISHTTGLSADHKVFFEWELGASDSLRIYIDSGTVRRQTQIGGVIGNDANLTSIGGYAQGTHTYWRIRHTGTTFTFEYSSDGTTWNAFSNSTLTEPAGWQTSFPSLTGKVRIRTVAQSTTANQTMTTYWDDFNVVPSSGGSTSSARKGRVMEYLERKYGVATTIRVPLIKTGTDQYATSADYTFAPGDITVSKDGGASSTLSDTTTVAPIIENGQLKFYLTATEMSAQTVDVRIKDTDATQVIEPLHIKIETYGNALAMVVWDKKQAIAVDADLVDLIWNEPLTEPTAPFTWAGTMRTAFNWLAALSRNKMTQTETTQTLRNDADTANIGTAATSDDGTTFTRGEWS